MLPYATASEPPSPETLAELGREVVQQRVAAWRHVFSRCTFAEVCLTAGCVEEGRRALALIGETDRQAFCGAEVLRIEGELMARGGRPGDGEPQRRQLAGIYRWFREGFDTRDLREAKRMLDTLG